eukprot:6075953-Amphidinium_carterae.1
MDPGLAGILAAWISLSKFQHCSKGVAIGGLYMLGCVKRHDAWQAHQQHCCSYTSWGGALLASS